LWLASTPGWLGVIHRRGAEAQRAAEGSLNVLSESVIGAAIEVHKHLGPGLLESVYEACVARELELRQIEFKRQAGIATSYKGSMLPLSFRVDFLVNELLMVELKAVESLSELHTAQMLTYLRLTDLRLGLLINFNVPALWRGVRRVANHL
jgi:GxxExxY protein